MLWQRLTFGGLMLAALFGLVRLDDWLAADAIVGAPASRAAASGDVVAALRQGAIVTSLTVVLCIFAVRELGALFVSAGHRPVIGVATLFAAAIAALPWIHTHFLMRRIAESELALLLLAAALMVAFAGVMRRKQTEQAATNVALTMFLVVYIGLLASYLPRLRLAAASPWLVIYVVLIVKSCDIGAFFTGLAIGRTKLIPWLSPKKSVEGLIGGVLTSMAVAAGGAAWAAAATGSAEAPVALASTRCEWPDVGDALVIGALLALIGQFGDLCESLLKRDARAKDSAALVPAFGGLLDILDSLLLTAPLAYWMLR